MNRSGKPWIRHRSFLRGWRLVALAVCLACLGSPPAGAVDLGDALWIWSPQHVKNQVPPVTCYFRKTFFVGRNGQPRQPDRGQLEIAADDRYEVFLNGRRVGSGQSWRQLDVYALDQYLLPGANVLAVRVENLEQGPAGLVARLTVRQAGSTDVSYHTDNTWRVSAREVGNWQSANFDDHGWDRADSYGLFGQALPWAGNVRLPEGTVGGRFRAPAGFRVERITHPSKTGPLVSMTFDAFGRILAAREGGPLLRIYDDNRDGVNEAVQVLTDKITAAQGLLVYRRFLYVVGEGPLGTGLYRLDDEAGDGNYTKMALMFKFDSAMSEHGAHTPILGPDGMIYVVLGNHAQPEAEIAPNSPYRHAYEGDLLQPRYEDAGGHAVGVRAPGGTIIRTDLAGKRVERFAGGLRNAYDAAFNRWGDLFAFDSDMEWDEGLPWYRPTRVCQITAGAEFGWRSGWAKWPAYYLDNLPATLNLGRGSPAGACFYEHHRFPAPYRDTLLLADWSMGQILSVRLQRDGGGYRAKVEPLLEGRPLNVTDMEVGPDGWLYFVTGGRGTEGGVYRLVWQGGGPMPAPPAGIQRAVSQPQLYSAWAQRQIEIVKRQLGAEWPKELARAAQDGGKFTTAQRTRALDIMQLVGPPPSKELLLLLSGDEDLEVRLKAAYLMGLHADEKAIARLVEMLGDAHPALRRQALESLARIEGAELPVDTVIGLLDDADRQVRFAARRTLTALPVIEWRDAVLADENLHVFFHGSVALMEAAPTPENATAILRRAEAALQGFLSDDDFVDLLRVMQLAVMQGNPPQEELARLAEALSPEYPLPTDKNPAPARRINRELIRLLAHLQDESLPQRLCEVLAGDEPDMEKLHAALCARYLETGWSLPQRLEVLAYLEESRSLPGGFSRGGYLDHFTRDMIRQLDGESRWVVLEKANEIPSAALAVLAELPPDPGPTVLQRVIQLDREVAENTSVAAGKLQTAIAAVLGRSGNAEAMAHLREVFETQPKRREAVAMALAQHPDGDNWPLLVRSVAILEGQAAAVEVLSKLLEVPNAPVEAEAYRQVILRGLELGAEGEAADKLLSYWTDETMPGETLPEKFTAWQEWFARTYPDSPPATLPAAGVENRWTYDDIARFLDNPSGYRPDTARGALVFQKAQCAKCHAIRGEGERIGPDLTTLVRRFHRKEIIESILYPSQVVSDQYRSKSVVTFSGKTYTGIVGPAGGDSVVVLQSNGEKVTIRKAEIEEIVPQKQSAMPEGLLNKLTLEEIADLFAYLQSGGSTDTTARSPGTSRRPQ